MEPSTVMRDHVLNPTSIYSQIESWERVLGHSSAGSSSSWETSLNNPKNRIESLTPRKDASWCLDGVDPEGTRFFAYPTFARGRPPLRIDVFIPGQQDHPLELRHILRSASTVFVRGNHVAGLEISQHLLRALQSWTARTSGFEALYHDMPFGSRIVVNDIRADVDSMEVVLHPIYNIEQNWFSVKALQEMWHLDSALWPDVVDYADLQLQAQPHESITLVQIPSRRRAETLVFKSLAQDVKYMYHELKMLLTLERHPNIIGPPLYIVTKKCRFGGKIGVCGFILPFYPLGTMGKTLQDSPRGALSIPLLLKDRFRWARQITGALLHINDSPLGFYPDLKPDNVLLVLGTEGLNTTLIDLEQRGGWYSWSPPEVRYIEYLEYIATRVECPPVRAKSLALLKSFIPGWKLPTQADRYREGTQGFSAAWLKLKDGDREAAQVFMLGKLLWCIFEGTSSVNCGIGFDMFREQEVWRLFPEFKDTPDELRACIRACTAGSPEWEGRFRSIVRRGTKYYDVERLSMSGALDDATPKETQEAAMRWWKEEVRIAKRFIEQKVRAQNGEDTGEAGEVVTGLEKQVRLRPSLRSILEQIEKTEAVYCVVNAV